MNRRMVNFAAICTVFELFPSLFTGARVQSVGTRKCERVKVAVEGGIKPKSAKNLSGELAYRGARHPAPVSGIGMARQNGVMAKNSRALLIVDVQPTFCEGGALGVEGGTAVAEGVARFVAEKRAEYELIVTTEDRHIDPGA